MTWLTWRQFRAQVIAAAAAAAVLAILLAVTGPHMAHLYDSSGIATCTGVSCGPISDTFGNELPWFDTVIYLVGLGIMFLVGRYCSPRAASRRSATPPSPSLSASRPAC